MQCFQGVEKGYIGSKWVKVNEKIIFSESAIFLKLLICGNLSFYISSFQTERLHQLKLRITKKENKRSIPGPNLDLLCVRQSDVFCENHAKLHFDAKH